MTPFTQCCECIWTVLKRPPHSLQVLVFLEGDESAVKHTQKLLNINNAQSTNASLADTLSPRSSPTRKWISRFNYWEIWPLFLFYFGFIPAEEDAHFQLRVCFSNLLLDGVVPSACHKPPVYFRFWQLVVAFLFSSSFKHITSQSRCLSPRQSGLRCVDVCVHRENEP